MSKVKCPCCGKEVSLTKAGNLYMHKPEFSLGWEWCEGSKQNYEMLMGEMLAEEIQEETQTEEEKKEEIKKVFTQLSKLQFEDQENVSNEKYISLDSEENQLNELAIQYLNSGSLTFLNQMHEILEASSKRIQEVLDGVLIDSLKKEGFQASLHPHPRRDILIKTQSGEVVITKSKKLGYLIDYVGEYGIGFSVRGLNTHSEIITCLNNEFYKSQA